MIEDSGDQISNEEGDLEVLRANYYALLSTLLSRPPDDGTIEMIRSLEGNDTPMGKQLGILSEFVKLSNSP